MKLNHAASLAALLVAARAGTALAADADPGEGAHPSVLPNVLATAAGTTLLLRLDYVHLEGLSTSLLGLQLGAQHITALGFGGYVALPLAFAVGDGDSEGAVGNLELGGLYVIRSAGGPDVYLRGGFALDTADDTGALAVPTVTAVPRLVDALPTGLATSWIRSGGGVRGRTGGFVYGGALSVDIPLDSGAGGPDAFLGFAASLGAELPEIGVSVGVALIQAFGGGGGGDDSLLGANLVADVPVGPSARLFGAFGARLGQAQGGYSLGMGVRLDL